MFKELKFRRFGSIQIRLWKWNLRIKSESLSHRSVDPTFSESPWHKMHRLFFWNFHQLPSNFGSDFKILCLFAYTEYLRYEYSTRVSNETLIWVKGAKIVHNVYTGEILTDYSSVFLPNSHLQPNLSLNIAKLTESHEIPRSRFAHSMFVLKLDLFYTISV